MKETTYKDLKTSAYDAVKIGFTQGRLSLLKQQDPYFNAVYNVVEYFKNRNV